MDCPNCSAPHPDAARFCARCGTPLYAGSDRSGHFAAHPEEPVRALAVMSTLMPHLAGGRHHIYRGVIALALLGALVAAAFGMLSIALVIAAITLPATVLIYMHDHDVWREEPLTVMGGAFLLALALGVGVGLLEHDLTKPVLLGAPSHQLPAPSQILQLGVFIPFVAFVAVLIAPILVTARSAFRHPVDAVVICSLSGAAFSLGLSVVVQRGAFSHIGAAAGDPTHVAFIALTLGFLQPIIFATAAAMAVLPLRGASLNIASGLAKGLALLVLYELTTVLLTSYGTRGIVLTTLAAVTLAAAGLLGTRNALHTTLLAEAQTALTGNRPLNRAPETDQICAHCGAAIGAGAAFCQACGTATAALAHHPVSDTAGHKPTDNPGTTMTTPTPPQTPPPPHYPSGAERVGHRLRPAAIAAIIAVVILIAAAVTAAIVLTGKTSPPEPRPFFTGSRPGAAALWHSGTPRPLSPTSELAGTPKTAHDLAITLTAAGPIPIAQGISITPAPGWTLANRGPNWVTLYNADNTGRMRVIVKTASGTDVVAVLQADINQKLASTGMSNVAILGTPATRTLQSRNFQQAASVDYTADYSAQLGTTHLLGAFMELLNTSNQLSAFIDYRETSYVTNQTAGSEMMVNSML